jgi:Raf kinase inhibitor-like YbhB/YbcL family protein
MRKMECPLMYRSLRLLIASSFLFCAASFGSALALDLGSPAFTDGGAIPKVHGCGKMGGKDMSPELEISGVSSQAKSLALIIDDPDAKSVAGKTWVHWVVSDLAPDTTNIASIKRGKIKLGLAGRNSSGSRAYQGMCPPNGKHTYVFAVYELSSVIGKKLGTMTRKKFEKKYSEQIISKSELRGTYQ